MVVKKTNNKKNNIEEKHFILSLEKKKKLLGIFIIIFAFLSLLSIVSYSRYDQVTLHYGFTDIFKVFSSDPEFVSKVENTHNWLGVFGALVSDFFINSTLGYFSTVFPLILLLFGFYLVKKYNFKILITSVNYILILSILLASLSGLLRNELGYFTDMYEAAGYIGNLIGVALGRLLGAIGGITLLTTIILVVFVIAFDIKIEKIADGLKSFYGWVTGFRKEKLLLKKKMFLILKK
jgi:DNA segregation ATPase FtsK/SpoIIIE, S-DNA-T family